MVFVVPSGFVAGVAISLPLISIFVMMNVIRWPDDFCTGRFSFYDNSHDIMIYDLFHFLCNVLYGFFFFGIVISNCSIFWFLLYLQLVNVLNEHVVQLF